MKLVVARAKCCCCNLCYPPAIVQPAADGGTCQFASCSTQTHIGSTRLSERDAGVPGTALLPATITAAATAVSTVTVAATVTVMSLTGTVAVVVLLHMTVHS